MPEVKDTIHKHSLLYHMTYWVLEKFPDSGDLYSELGPVTRFDYYYRNQNNEE